LRFFSFVFDLLGVLGLACCGAWHFGWLYNYFVRLLFWWLLASAMGSVYIFLFFSFLILSVSLLFFLGFICFTSFTIIPTFFLLSFCCFFFFTPFFVRRFVLYGWSALLVVAFRLAAGEGGRFCVCIDLLLKITECVGIIHHW
jgi:hypothetical protein